MNRTKVLIADDHTIMRKDLISILKNEVDVQVIGEAQDGREAVEKTHHLNPDIVIMDITMPNLNGIEATRQIKKEFPDVDVLILTMHTTAEYILQILHAGASGYLVKQTADTELISAIHAVAKGESYLSSSVSKKVINEIIQKDGKISEVNGSDKLTNRELEILQLIAEGKSNRKIAEMLYLSVKTVETHKTHITEKLNIHSTAELTKYAIRKGYTSLE